MAPPLAPVHLTTLSSVVTPLQTTTLTVLATYALFALFVSLTAFLAARNVLGDVPKAPALVVGPPLAAIAFLAATFEFNAFLALGLALAVDFGLLGYLYGVRGKLAAYVTLIHFVLSVLLGAILFGIVVLLASAPG
jgi:hypothetical protein